MVSVLKSGGDYDLGYVTRMIVNVRKHVTVPHRFICLTDLPMTANLEDDGDDVHWMELRHNLPSWWSKLELFRVTGKVVTFDLDVVLTASANPLASLIDKLGEMQMLMLRGFRRENWNSSSMCWNGDYTWVLAAFLEEYKRARHIEDHRGHHLVLDNTKYHGDQEWIAPFLQAAGVNLRATHRLLPGVYSYKNHLTGAEQLPEDAWLVCFHGKPRPIDLAPRPEWLHVNWTGATRFSEITETECESCITAEDECESC